MLLVNLGTCSYHRHVSHVRLLMLKSLTVSLYKPQSHHLFQRESNNHTLQSQNGQNICLRCTGSHSGIVGNNQGHILAVYMSPPKRKCTAPSPIRIWFPTFPSSSATGFLKSARVWWQIVRVTVFFYRPGIFGHDSRTSQLSDRFAITPNSARSFLKTQLSVPDWLLLTGRPAICIRLWTVLFCSALRSILLVL